MRIKPVDSLKKLHKNDSGMISIANCVCVLLCGLMIVATINNCHVANRKIERQVAADSVAQSTGVWMARGMNAITATNHLMGEMLSLVVLHEAIGGKKLEKQVSAANDNNRSQKARKPTTLKQRDNLLQAAYWSALAASKTGLVQTPNRDVFRLVIQRREQRTLIRSEATMLDSKMSLKEALERTYYGLAFAAALKSNKFTYPFGVILEKVMLLFERKIQQEYLTLNAIDEIAQKLIPAKRVIRDQILPFAKRYTTMVKHMTPAIAREVAREIGRLNGVTADVFPTPGQLQLPVQIDPLALAGKLPVGDQIVPAQRSGCGCPSKSSKNSRVKVVKTTQLARATFPWVNYHRKPLLDFFDRTLQFANASKYYRHWTTEYSKTILDEVQTGNSNPDSHLGLYVLKGYTGPDKGFEHWNLASRSETVDDLFTVIGLAHQAPPSVVGQPIFRQQQPRGSFAWSMALIYNGNDQQRPNQRINPRCNRIVPIRQANVGMDTLNWFPGSRQHRESCKTVQGENLTSHKNEHRPFELVGIALPAEYPKIQINWQSKLVPTTAYRMNRLKRASLPGVFEAATNSLPDQFPTALSTH